MYQWMSVPCFITLFHDSQEWKTLSRCKQINGDKVFVTTTSIISPEELTRVLVLCCLCSVEKTKLISSCYSILEIIFCRHTTKDLFFIIKMTRSI